MLSDPVLRRCRRSACLLALAAAIAPVDALELSERWREITAGTGSNDRGMVAGDFDNDGLPDLAVAAEGPAVIIRIEGVAQGTWRNKQVLLSPHPDGYQGEIPVSWPRTGGDHLVLVETAGTATEYSGWPLVATRVFPVANRAQAAAIGDANADGIDELIVSTADHVLAAYSLGDGALLWTAPHAARDIELAQLDTDGALEIILASQPGLVLDGATRAEQWRYDDGFGAYLTAGHFGTDSSTWFAAARDWETMLVFRSNPLSPVWDYSDFDFDAIDACDVEQDGRDEILLADGQWGGIHVIDTATRTRRLNIGFPGHGTAGLVGRDYDGDGACDVAHASRSHYVDRLYRIYNPVSGMIEHESEPVTGTTSAIALADLDGDGRSELLMTAGTSPTRLIVADSATGDVLWEATSSIANAHEPFYMAVQRLLVGQADADPALEIVLAGNTFYDGRVTIVDSATRAVQGQIGTYASGPLQSRGIIDAELMDYDQSPGLEVVVATQPESSGASGAKLHVLSLATGGTMWESVAMGSGFSDIVGVEIAQTDADPALEMVAILPRGLRAYDAATQLLDWSTVLSEEVIASTVDHSTGIVVLGYADAIETRSLATREVLRRITTAPLSDALAVLPGGGRTFLALQEGRIRLYDLLDGMPLAETNWIGSSLPGGAPAAEAHSGGWTIASASVLGYFVHEALLVDENKVFSNGFEP